jgi:hypothetical protein
VRFGEVVHGHETHVVAVAGKARAGVAEAHDQPHRSHLADGLQRSAKEQRHVS